MNSPIIIRARIIVITLLLAVAVFGFGTAAYAKPANSAVKPEANSKAAAFACGLLVAPLVHVSPGGGDNFQVFVSTSGGANCTYVVRTAPNWVEITNRTSSSFHVTVHANWTVQRSGTFVISAAIRQGDVTTETDPLYIFMVVQSAGSCSYSFDKTSLNFPNGNGSGYLQVTASDSHCPRNAATNANWLSITSGNDADSSGPIGYSVAANLTGPARTGKITLGNATCTVTQESGCDSWFSPSSKSFDAAGGSGAINVTTSDAACPRSATSNANWITIVGGNNSFGSGPVTYTVAINAGPARSGQIKLSGNAQPFTVMQAEGCGYTLSSSIFNFQPGNGISSIQVTASSSLCTWSPVSSASWVKITSAAQVTGNGTVNFTVDPNSGANRTATITVANKTATINQFGNNCTFTISPSSWNVGANGGSSSIQVTASSDTCPWTPVSSALWLKITNGINPKMLGNGTVTFSVDPNPGAARTATITIGNKTATINQSANQSGADCTFTINPGNWQVGAGGGEMNVNVTASKDSCKWYVGNLSPFISVVNGGLGGIGSGSMKFKAQPNAGAARTGFAEIAGHTFNVIQDGVNAQAMTIFDLSPGFAAKGGKEFLLVVKGTNFTSASRVHWNGQERPTTFYNNAMLGAVITANDIAAEGVFDVMVSNTGNGDKSNAEPFMVYGAVANVSSASFKGDVLAPASLVSAFGVDLAKGVKIADSQPLPNELEGTTVTIADAAGIEHKAQLFFVSPGQINYLMPEGAATGKATVMIKSGSGHTSVGTMEIAPVAPGLFTANASGQGLAIALVLRVKANGQQVYEPVAQYDATTGAFIAKPIDVSVVGEQVYLIFYGTGFRYRSSLNSVSLEMGGVLGNVVYAGMAPGLAGLDQINVLAPNNLAGRGEVEVALMVEGKKANTVKLNFK